MLPSSEQQLKSWLKYYLKPTHTEKNQSNLEINLNNKLLLLLWKGSSQKFSCSLLKVTTSKQEFNFILSNR